MSPRAGWPLAAVTVLAFFFVIGIVLDAIAPAPSGPPLSSFATTSGGVAAYAELLTRAGHPVSQLREPLTRTRLPRGATLVALGVDVVSPAGTSRIRQFLAAGGRIVESGAPVHLPPPLGDRVVHLDDPSFLTNAKLADDGNAARGLSLAGPTGTPVVFDELLHGYGPATGLAALPARWWVALGGLGLALAAWSLSRAVRLGGADPVDPRLQAAPRVEYVDALAGALSRGAREPELRRLVEDARERERKLAKVAARD